MKKRKDRSRRFVRDVVGVSLIVSIVLIGTLLYLSSRVQHDISWRYIRDAETRTTERFLSMQNSIERSLEMVRKSGELGALSLAKPSGLKSQLLPLFDREPLLSGISVADTAGKSYFIQPDGTERLPSNAAGFDPRTRPWFAPALETKEIFWTQQYRFHTLQQIGITAAAIFTPPKGKEPMVVAFDILLADFYREIKGMAPSPKSNLIIFRRGELLFVPDSAEESSDFIPIDSITNSLEKKAYTHWEKGGDFKKEVFSFRHEGEVWWCDFKPVGILKPDQKVWLGVLIPASDIMGETTRRRTILLIIGLGFLSISVGGAVWLSRRYSHSIRMEHRIENTEEGVLSLIQIGENRYIEFKSTLRMNLHTKKPGKEIELAWLKGVAAFLNTDGGTLLLGVTDDGEITGLERDVFENDDKCRLHFKNLIATHLGAEFSKYIRFRLVQAEGKTVGIIHCSRSPDPVFLKNGNKEAFYIRNGPSSDELPVSQALHYISQRK